MKIAILTANLGKFDTEVENVFQVLPKGLEYTFHRFKDEDFPPVTGLTPRFQYRIPKLFGWEMFPGYDYYLWLDGSFSLQHKQSLSWFLDRIVNHDIALFTHPWRKTIKEEVEHIDLKLSVGSKYIVPRYANGLHREMLDVIQNDQSFKDDKLFTSTAFIYHNTRKVQEALMTWWYYQSRYYTCDQVSMSYALRNLNINIIEQNQYRIPYLSLTSKHR